MHIFKNLSRSILPLLLFVAFTNQLYAQNDSLVKVDARLTSINDSTYRIQYTISVNEGWHVYGQTLSSDALTDTITAAPHVLFNLETINFECNSITKLHDTLFKNLINLKELKLYQNQLESINRNIFKGLINLEYLYLSFNSIKNIHSKSFRDLKNLKVLHLASNQLKSEGIEKLFRKLSNLNEIYLQNNKIFEIDVQIFNGFFNLKKLNLQNNPLLTPELGNYFFYFHY